MLKKSLILLTLLTVFVVLGTGCGQKAISPISPKIPKTTVKVSNVEEDAWVHSPEFGETRGLFENPEGTRLWVKAYRDEEKNRFTMTLLRYSLMVDGIRVVKETNESYDDLEFGLRVGRPLIDGKRVMKSNFLLGRDHNYRSTSSGFKSLDQKDFGLIDVGGFIVFKVERDFPVLEGGKGNFLFMEPRKNSRGIYTFEPFLSAYSEYSDSEHSRKYHEKFPLQHLRGYNMMRIRQPNEGNRITFSTRGNTPNALYPLKIEGKITAVLKTETGTENITISIPKIEDMKIVIEKDGKVVTHGTISGMWFNYEDGVWMFGTWGRGALEQEVTDFYGSWTITDKSGVVYEITPVLSFEGWKFLHGVKGGSTFFHIFGNRIRAGFGPKKMPQIEIDEEEAVSVLLSE